MSDTTYDKILPEAIPAWQAPYWEGLREHVIKVQSCSRCSRLRHIPKEICPSCHSSEFGWVEIGQEGEVFTYTIVHRGPTPAFQADAPYALVHVAMDDGVRMIADLVGDGALEVAIGQRVRAVFDDVTPEWTLLRFTRSEES